MEREYMNGKPPTDRDCKHDVRLVEDGPPKPEIPVDTSETNPPDETSSSTGLTFSAKTRHIPKICGSCPYISDYSHGPEIPKINVCAHPLSMELKGGLYAVSFDEPPGEYCPFRHIEETLAPQAGDSLWDRVVRFFRKLYWRRKVRKYPRIDTRG